MAESTYEQNAAATRAKDNPEERVAAGPQKLKSTLIIFEVDGEIRVDDEGEFDLNITPAGVVTGTHTRPMKPPKNVNGTLSDTVPPVIEIRDGSRKHRGVLVGKQFIGRQEPDVAVGAPDDKEEGVWVGTKVP